MKRFFFAILAFTNVTNAPAQTNYSFTNCISVTGTYIDISATGTTIPMTNPETGSSTTAQNIGFTFTFNGTNFTQFMIHADGILRLGTSAPGASTIFATNPGFSNGNVFSSVNPSFQNIIMPFFCDMVQGQATPEFHVLTTGTAPDRVCTIQWKNLRDADNASSNLQHQFSNMEFQIKLFENTNNIEFVYGNWVPSGNTASERLASAGIKASPSSFIYHSKYSSSNTFNVTEFFPPSVNSVLPPRFAFRSQVPPVAGHIIRFYGQQANDINVAELYADEYIPNSVPISKNIQALIKNEGTLAASNIPVTLTVSGSNSYTETINIATLAAGAGQVVSFSAFSVPIKGDQIVQVSITPATDDRTDNNSRQIQQMVTSSRLQPYDDNKRISSGIGSNSSTIMFATKMYGSGTRKISQIRTRFMTYIRPYDIRIYEDNGTGGAPGASAIFSTAEFKTDRTNEVIVPVNPSVTVTGDYYIVIAQRSSTLNIGNEFTFQYPVTPQKVYTTFLNGTTWSEQTSDRPFNILVSAFEEIADTDVGIEAVTSPFCSYSNNTDVNFSIRNFSNAAHDYSANPVTISGFVKDSVNNSTIPFSVTKNTGTIPAEGTDIVTVLTGYDFLSRGYHQFNAKTICANDKEPGNDSLNFYIFNKVLVTKSPADSVCLFGSTTLSGNTTYLFNFQWYRDRNYTELFSSGNVATVNTLLSDSVFYVKALDYRNCELRDSVIVYVRKNLPLTPVITTSDSVLSHRNGFLTSLNVSPLSGHSIIWEGLGVPSAAGTLYEVKGFLPVGTNLYLNQAGYSQSGCQGKRDTKYTLYAPGVLMNNNDPLTVCDSSFYAGNGPAANYLSGQTFTKTFTPATAGTKMTITIYNLNLGSQGFLVIYDGTTASSPQIASLTSSNNSNTPQIFSASNPSGVITVRFSSGSTTGRGWLAGLTCQEPLQFRTVSNGAFTSNLVWESRPVGSGTYTAATRPPNKGDDTIIVRHLLTLSSDVPLDQTIIDNGAELIFESNINLYKTIPGSEIEVNGTLTIGTGRFIGNSTTNLTKAIIKVNGTLINNGEVFIDTIVMSGTAIPSVLAGNGQVVNLRINNPSGVQVTGNQSIIGNLNLQNGIVQTQGSGYLMMKTGFFTPEITGGSSLSYIDGRFRWQTFSTSNPLLFPLGNNGLYRPAELLVSQNSFDFPVEYEGQMIAAAPPVRNLPGSLSNVNPNWYHHFEITSGQSFFNEGQVTLYYFPGDGVMNNTILRVAKDDGSSDWVDIGGNGTANGTGSITSNVFTSFSDFVLANLNLSPLPLSLLEFTGKKQGSQVLLQWKTNTEINTSYFEVQRSVDGQSFISIGRVNAQNSSGVHHYLFADAQPLMGNNYYRLKMVDIDGRFTYSAVVRITIDKEVLFTVFPNPVNNVMTVAGLKQGGQLRLLSSDGKLLQQWPVTTQSMTMDISRYAKGMYYLQYQYSGEVLSQSIIKQ